MTIVQSPDHGASLLLADPGCSRWLKDVDRFLPIKPHFVLYGNIRDRHPFPLGDGQYDMRTTAEFLVDYLHLKGYEHFIAVYPLYGVTVLAPTTEPTQAFVEKTVKWLRTLEADSSKQLSFTLDKVVRRVHSPASFAAAVELAEKIAHNRTAKSAVIFDYLMGQTEQGQTRDSEAFVRSLIFSYEVRPLGNSYNTVFWLCDRENDLPAWFTLNNPRIRSVSLSRPNGKIRTLVSNSMLNHVPGYGRLSAEEKQRAVQEFSQQTDGLLMNDLEAIVRFAPAQDLGPSDIGEAARRYKLGVTEDPWREIGRARIADAERTIRQRVKGQEPAITKTLDIMRRAIIGLAGAQGSRSSGKPKGILFFAGPTGVGKTELAKSLTEGLFGDETAYIRFDMSEFNHEHSDQRLIGAPPGYVGYEAGGELTDAIRERPFSVVLFDEIEKAHPRILDKFLQILDDGQLTSGKGERVYFSDAIIIFTSNLGMDSGQITMDDSYEMLTEKVRGNITAHFKEKINRPELLNRIGDNVVVFDFIRATVALEILRKLIDNTLRRMEELGYRIVLPGFSEGGLPAPGSAYEFIVRQCTADLRNGGRGVSNVLESVFINPLSRAIFDIDLRAGQQAVIASITKYGESHVPVVDLVRQ